MHRQRTAQVFSAASRALVLLLGSACALFLASCFESDKALFTDADAVTPFPVRFAMSEVNPDGSIKLTDKGENPRATATLDGHTYRTSDGMSYRFISLSTPNTFVIQIQGSGQNCLYILARLTGDIVALYYPPDTGDATLDPTILATGATPDEGFGKTWKFTSDAQVLSAMAAFAQHLPAVPAGVRRVAFTDAQIAQLDRDIAEALFKFGERSFLGQGVPQDYGKAREWFQKAAAAGNADGMAGLGFCYRDGQGVDRDFDQAAAWYEKAAAAGNADAMAGLGLLYEHGWGVYRSSNEAAVWYQRAAAAGNADGKSALARLHTQQAADEASQSWVNQHPVAAGLAALHA